MERQKYSTHEASISVAANAPSLLGDSLEKTEVWSADYIGPTPDVLEKMPFWRAEELFRWQEERWGEAT